MTRWLWALGYGTAALVLLASDHRVLAGVVTAGAACHLWGVRKGLVLGPTSATLDHVIPHSRGGSDEMGNLVTCCREHNLDKGNRTPEEWRAGIVVDSTARERASIPAEVRLAVYARDNWTCAYCGVDVS